MVKKTMVKNKQMQVTKLIDKENEQTIKLTD